VNASVLVNPMSPCFCAYCNVTSAARSTVSALGQDGLRMVIRKNTELDHGGRLPQGFEASQIQKGPLF
jgi:hypothetical protein